MATIDAKKEEFRKYLEKTGVVDSLTKVLVGLYEEPEKPSDAVEYLQQHMSTGAPDTADIETLQQENADLKLKNEELTAALEEAQTKIAELQAAAPAVAED